jgi:aromatic ring-cleaving dioxygenase
MAVYLIHVYFEADDEVSAWAVQERISEVLDGTAAIDLLEEPEEVADTAQVDLLSCSGRSCEGL